ncbi:hypothetical protein GCM10010259_69060 [Streptomyces daghestanicus]|uniref:Uncharacterized protein n=2 Tax=Streptomyces daghestanicus TaxID=66885 RepID=A0ABQ3Q7C4_9ACTN|nr:hypothetical protein GCM10010259_69060 [Streptomyces daghestanicus]GHI33178.1 hypothetical protein Sdagh_49080 [Streptomyces daghestanicus]
MFSNGDSTTDSPASAVAARTEAILEGRQAAADPIASLKELADSLPSLDEVQAVAEDDTSELTDTERQQKDKTESVIRTAVAAGNTAIWIIAQGLERAAKGKWWRRSHPTYAAYVNDLTGRSASYIRRLRSGAPLALETAAQTGRVPNPGQIEETRKAQRQHGTEAAILLFQVVSEVTEELGDKTTAETLEAVRKELPSALPEVPEQARATIERVTRRTLGHGGGDDEPAMFEEDSNDGVRIRTPDGEASASGPQESSTAGNEGDDIEDAEIVPEHMVALKDALKTLNTVNRAITKDVFTQAAADPDDAEEYERVRQVIIKRATAIRNKALHAPKG